MPRTPKVVEDRREQIIDAAMRVFSEKGFTRASNKDIARAAGITPGLIYHYFVNKEDVLKAIIENRSPLKLARTFPPQMLEMPPKQLLRFMIKQVLHIVEDEQFVQIIRVLLPEIVHNPAMTPFGANVLQQILNFVGHYLASNMEQGKLRQADTTLIAQMFIGSVMTFVLRRQVLCDPAALQYTHEQIADAIVDTMLNGLLPR